MRSTRSRMLGCPFPSSEIVEAGTLVGLLPFSLHFCGTLRCISLLHEITSYSGLGDREAAQGKNLSTSQTLSF